MAGVLTLKSTCSTLSKWGGSSLYLSRMNLSASSSPLASAASSGGPGSSKSGSSSSGAPGAADPASKVKEPPSFVFKKLDGPLGPGASKSSKYKNPEYFLYHALSYTDMDVVMAKYRLPQPSSKKSK